MSLVVLLDSGPLRLVSRVVEQAAEYWAAARNLGRKDAVLEGDVILAAQAKSAGRPAMNPSSLLPMSGTWTCL